VIAVDVNPELTGSYQGADRSALRCVVGDVATEATNTDYVITALEPFGRIDVMICNAGIALATPIHETPPEVWDRVMGVNFKAICHAARHVVPVMKQLCGGLFPLTGSIY
jgi:NAD(P)-dependent dehydrogenase (short-subunit alcohol dehydrogenase family)